MELELPKRLYAEGSEPRVKKINNSCRMELIRDLKKAMCAEYDDVKRDHVFTHIMAIAENDLKFSGKLVDSFICRQLITSKLHEKWFVFARTPLRFSLQEYHAVTGLKITRETNTDVVKWKNDGGFWSNLLHTGGKITLQSIRKVHLQEVHTWTRLDRMRLIYLCVIVGVVMGRDEKVSIPHMYIKLVMDFDKVRKFHWGLHSYDFLLSSIEKAMKKLGRRVSDSFKGPRCGNWKGVAKDNLFSVISVTGNGNVFLDVDYIRKGEMEDQRVDLLLERIRNKYDWSSTDWQWNDEQIDRTKEDSPDAALVFFREEDWEKVRTWSTSSTRLRIGPATLDFEIANRLMDKSEWVDSLYGKGVLPPHGRTHEIWNIDVDRLYVPVHGRKRYKEVDGFANLIPRIVKAVQPMRHQKDFSAYTVFYVPVGNLNKSACDCGVYAVKFIECHALGLELSLLHDGNIIEARHRILWDLWEAANDPELIDRMSKYQSPECLSSTVEEIL
uniref:Ubiquitin-like protease family profile domain-containing protein n=1 Tax=Brassica oleracea var. oleracea TaxID=109376 RepID=A0A0D3CL92_BRAOL